MLVKSHNRVVCPTLEVSSLPSAVIVAEVAIDSGKTSGISLYSYVRNDPVNAIDPSGLESIEFSGGSVWWFKDDGSQVKIGTQRTFTAGSVTAFWVKLNGTGLGNANADGLWIRAHDLAALNNHGWKFSFNDKWIAQNTFTAESAPYSVFGSQMKGGGALGQAAAQGQAVQIQGAVRQFQETTEDVGHALDYGVTAASILIPGPDDVIIGALVSKAIEKLVPAGLNALRVGTKWIFKTKEGRVLAGAEEDRAAARLKELIQKIATQENKTQELATAERRMAEAVARPLSTESKDLLRASARDIWQAKTGRRAIWDGLDIHHRIPLEWSHIFPYADPNRVANLVGMSPENHTLVTNAWNAWKQSLRGRTPTQAELLNQAVRIDEQFGNLMKFLP